MSKTKRWSRLGLKPWNLLLFRTHAPFWKFSSLFLLVRDIVTSWPSFRIHPPVQFKTLSQGYTPPSPPFKLRMPVQAGDCVVYPLSCPVFSIFRYLLRNSLITCSESFLIGDERVPSKAPTTLSDSVGKLCVSSRDSVWNQNHMSMKLCGYVHSGCSGLMQTLQFQNLHPLLMR